MTSHQSLCKRAAIWERIGMEDDWICMRRSSFVGDKNEDPCMSHASLCNSDVAGAQNLCGTCSLAWPIQNKYRRVCL